VEWVVIELVLRYSELKIETVASFDSGQIAGAFSDAMSGRDHAMDLARRYTDLVSRRNDLLHARPATIEGKQRLYRWEMRREKVGPISDETLAAFLADAEMLSRDLDTERSG
jgi:hypothetical protein